jgi:membrane protease YdiL (CAAX protease family)
VEARRLWFANDGLVRAPWRIVLFILIAVVAVQAASAIVYPVVQWLAGTIGARLILYGWLSVIGLLVAHAICLRRIDGLPWTAAGLHLDAARPSLLVVSALIGGLAIAIPSLLLVAFGLLEFRPDVPGSSLREAVRSLIFLAPLAFSEELMLRGYILTVLRARLDWRVAVGLTSIVFGLLHIPNPGSNAASITIVILAGLLLGTLMVRTGSLYAATAAHLAWNWVMAGLLHAPVSGLASPTPDYRLVDAGPDWLTGGTWGPEGGFAAAVGMGAALGFLYVWRVRPREA